MGRNNLSTTLGVALIAGSLGISGCGKKKDSKDAANPLPFEVKFTATIEGDTATDIMGRLELSNVKVKNDEGELAVKEGKKDFPKAWDAAGGGGYKVECYVPVTEGEPAKKLMKWNGTDKYEVGNCGSHNEKVVFLISKQEELDDETEAVDESADPKEYKYEVALPGALELAWKVGDNSGGSSTVDLSTITANNGAIPRAKPYVALTWNKDEKIVLDYVVNQQSTATAFGTAVALDDDDKPKLGPIYGTVDGETAGTPQASPFLFSAGADNSGGLENWSTPDGPFNIAINPVNNSNANDPAQDNTDGFQITFTAKAEKKTTLFTGGTAVAVRTVETKLTVDE